MVADVGTSAKAKAPSGRAEVGKLYFSKPHIATNQWGDEGIVVDRAWFGVPGWVIKASSGATVTLPSPIDRRGKAEDPSRLESFNKFWTWVYKNGLANDAKRFLDTLDTDQVDLATAPKSQRDKMIQKKVMLPSVRKLLTALTQKQHEKFVESLVNSQVSALEKALEGFRAFQSANPRARFSFWLTRGAPKSLSPYSSFLLQAVQQDRVTNEVVRKPDYMNLAISKANAIADDVREGFVYKNGYKLSLIISGKGNLEDTKVLRMNGGGDYGGEIMFTFKDGSRFIVRNKMVFKVSPLGKYFMQYPTTFHRVFLPDGSAMRQPSEENMVQVFARQ